MQISRRALQQARIHLAEGDRLQASEKASGAVAAATKGVAESRNWAHDNHALRNSVVSQLAAELGRSTPDAQALYRGRAAANEQHQNYFDNVALEDDILRDIGFAEAYVLVIERMMSVPPRPFTVSEETDSYRIAQITGHRVDRGVTDALGFANFTGELRAG